MDRVFKKMELITVNFLSIGSFFMLIFYMSNGLCEIKFASATAIQSGIGGGASSMSITGNGEFKISISHIVR